MTAALIRTEAIKLRRTVGPWIALVCPAIVCFLELIALLNIDQVPVLAPAALWRDLLRGGWIWWLAFIAPMLTCFEAAYLINLEHSGRLWKQLFAFPIARASVYATKMLFCGLMVGISFPILMLGFLGDGLIFSGLRGLHLASAIPWVELLSIAGKGYLASWLIIVVQIWISTRLRGAAAPIGIGFAALAIGFVLFGMFSRHGAAFFSWYPWTMPFRTLSTGARDAHNTWLPAVFGCIGGVLFGWLACWDLARRTEGD